MTGSTIISKLVEEGDVFDQVNGGDPEVELSWSLEIFSLCTPLH